MNTESISLLVEWQIKDGKFETVLKSLAEVSSKSVNEEGILYFNVYQSNAEPNKLYLLEEYKDELAVDQHRQAEYYQRIVVGKILPILESRVVIQLRKMSLDDLKN